MGDIHGEIEPLEKALAWLRRWDGMVIFTGDYVNRGSQSRAVIDALVEFKINNSERVQFLLGNHDQALLEFVDSADPSKLLAHGGLTTLYSYLGDGAPEDPLTAFREGFPRSHHDFLTSLLPFWEDSDIFVSHSGLNPALPDSRQVQDVVCGSHPGLFRPGADLPKVVFSGHYAQQTGVPFISERFVCVDSGCGVLPGAPLSIVLHQTRKVISFWGQ